MPQMPQLNYFTIKIICQWVSLNLDGLKDFFDNQLKKIPRPAKIGLICVFSVILVGWILPTILWPGGIGIGKDSPVSTKTIEKDKQGNTVKTIETIKYDYGKTLWDWLSLLGVPLSLAILGYFLQQQQQKRAEIVSEYQRKIADNETKEEVLQTYFDRLSALLIDKSLIALSDKSQSSTIAPEEQELLDSALDVIRARTLSILRRFKNDAERKTSVIKFLIETDIVGKSKLNLSEANLSEANLEGANLEGVNLSGANLQLANLEGAYLREANLQKADLQGANLQKADLQGAYLREANLQGAYLQEAYLQEAKLLAANLPKANLQGANLQGAYLLWASLREANLQGANLERANLERANLQGANLERANLLGAYLQIANLEWANLKWANLQDIKWNSETAWPDKSQFDNAENIPEDLKKELDKLDINP